MRNGDDPSKSLQNLALFKLDPSERGRPAWLVQLWWIVRSLFFHTSPQFMFGWRRFLLRLFGSKIGRGVLIRPTVRVTYPWKLIIGDRSWIGDHVELYNLAFITIGSDAVVSQGSYICTGSHEYTDSKFGLLARPITIGSGAWIAAQAFVAPGTKIGTEAVIGVRSLVLQDVPDGMKAFGHPAVIVGPRI